MASLAWSPRMELDCEEKGPELPVVSHRLYITWLGLLQRLSCPSPGQRRPLSPGSPASLPGTDIAAATHWAHGCHSTVTMPLSSPQEGAKPPMPKSLTVVDPQRGAVSDPSDDVGSQVGLVSIDPDLVGWEM